MPGRRRRPWKAKAESMRFIDVTRAFWLSAYTASVLFGVVGLSVIFFMFTLDRLVAHALSARICHQKPRPIPMIAVGTETNQTQA